MGSNLSSGIVYACLIFLFLLSGDDTDLTEGRLLFQSVLQNIYKQNLYAKKRDILGCIGP
jgi:hypothetical protein